MLLKAINKNIQFFYIYKWNLFLNHFEKSYRKCNMVVTWLVFSPHSWQELPGGKLVPDSIGVTIWLVEVDGVIRDLVGKIFELLVFPCREMFLIVTDVETCLDKGVNIGGDAIDDDFKLEEEFCFTPQSRGRRRDWRLILSGGIFCTETVGCWHRKCSKNRHRL